MENQKNLFLAIAISMAIIFGFQFIMPQPDPIERSANDTNAETGIDLSQTTPQTIVTFEDKEKVLSTSKRVTFNNGKISGSINLSGAIIDDLVLLEYRKLLDINSEKINFLNPVGTKDSYSLDTGWVTTDTNIHLPDSSSLWSSSGSNLDGKNSVTLSWSNDQNMIFEKTISLDENYLFQVEQKIINKSELMFEAFPYGLSKEKANLKCKNFLFFTKGLCQSLIVS